MHLDIKDQDLLKRTKRLEIRPFKASDYKAYKKAMLETLPQQNEYDAKKSSAKNLTKEKYMIWLKNSRKARKKDLLYNFGIFLKKDGNYIGAITVCVIGRLTYQFANFGYHILNQHWGNGFATEACHAAIEICFKKLKLHRLEAGIQPENTASIKLAEKLNFTKEGIRRKYYFDGKQWLDLVYYIKIAEDIGIKRTKPVYGRYLNEYL